MQNIENKQQVLIKDRSAVEIDGVKSVRRFDEQSILLDTGCGKMVVDGSELRIESLDKINGRIEITGKVMGVIYVDFKEKRKGRGLFG